MTWDYKWSKIFDNVTWHKPCLFPGLTGFSTVMSFPGLTRLFSNTCLYPHSLYVHFNNNYWSKIEYCVKLTIVNLIFLMLFQYHLGSFWPKVLWHLVLLPSYSSNEGDFEQIEISCSPSSIYHCHITCNKWESMKERRRKNNTVMLSSALGTDAWVMTETCVHMNKICIRLCFCLIC